MRRKGKNTRKPTVAGRIGWSLFALCAMWMLFFLVTDEQYAWVRLASHIAPFIAILVFAVSLFALLTRRWLLAFLSFGLSVVIGSPYASQFSPNAVTANDQPSFKVMSYSKMGRNRDIESIARVIRSQKPDVLFLQEISEEDGTRLIALLDGLYGNEKLHYVWENNLGMIVTRFSVNANPSAEKFALSAQIIMGDRTIQLWNVHLQKSIFDTSLQYQMIDSIVQKISEFNGPTIVAGDLNATRENYPYKALAANLINAHEASGWGFGFTFPSRQRRIGLAGPFMRIDHIFFSSHFVSDQTGVVTDPGGSDHFPVVTNLSFESNSAVEN